MTRIRAKKGEIRLCSFPGCKNIHNALGLCHGHWNQQNRGKELQPLKYRVIPNSTCFVDNCDHPPRTLGYCVSHYSRVKKWGDPRVDIPLRKKGKSGEGYIDKDGYRVIGRHGKKRYS
jgi:hypothetical protein